MKIQLVDRNYEMCEQWKLYFNNCEDVIVYNGGFFDLETECVVSPANSFGFMDGGLDLVISDTLGWQIQRKLQITINFLKNTHLKDIELCFTTNDFNKKTIKKYIEYIQTK